MEENDNQQVSFPLSPRKRLSYSNGDHADTDKNKINSTENTNNGDVNGNGVNNGDGSQIRGLDSFTHQQGALAAELNKVIKTLSNYQSRLSTFGPTGGGGGKSESGL